MIKNVWDVVKKAFWDSTPKRVICKECGGTRTLNGKRCPFCDGRGWNVK